jgi:ATP-dependent helicase/nuclease subunit A
LVWGAGVQKTEPNGDRGRASTDLSCDLAVTAGAGAGKTSVLVDRFVAIARDPQIGPEHILAITFTRKAATEMKERAIRLFESSGETELRRATEAAYISTIHGFAERILRERPFDALVDPAFTVITDYEKTLWIQEALQAMYEREDLRVFAPRLKKNFDGEWRIFPLVSEVARLMREGSQEARREADAIGDDDRCVQLALDRARAIVARAEQEMLVCMRALLPMLDGATFKSHGAKYEDWRAYVEAVTDCLARTAAGIPSPVWRATSFTSEIPMDERVRIRPLLDDIKKLAPHATFCDWVAQEALERELLPLKRAVYQAAQAIDRSYAEHKRAIGALDFHDLQLCAAELLARNPLVRAEYAERFRHILLDESQDTDELQYRIIELLRTPRNTLFMVGDPKQAIFEFRGANPEVFEGAIAKLPEGNRLHLHENFRSRPEIISLINGFGASLLPTQFAHIAAKADYEGKWLSEPAISVIYAEQQLLPGGERKKHEPVSEARPREAAAVAEELVRLLGEGILVRDPEARNVEWKPLRPKHIAILFRARTAIPYFERALADRGIPYVTASGQGFYERAEVLDCLMMLRVIEQPLDDLAMAAVLRSPFVGATDADLWRLREPTAATMPAVWDALRGYAPLAECCAAFTALRSRVRGAPAADALDDAIRTFGYEAALAAHEDGPAMLANLAKLRRQLRDMGSISALSAFQELKRRRELLFDEATAPLVGSADDVVVLTTIHQAKGLEWPVVCLPNLQSSGRHGAPLFSARHGALLCDALDAEGTAIRPLSLESLAAEIRTRAEAEERRLLYVALTRARERLILSACVKQKVDADKEQSWRAKAFSPLSFLQSHDEGTLTDEGEHDCGSYHTLVTYVRGPAIERTKYQGGASLAATWSPQRGGAPERAPAAIAALPLSLKVTELLSYRRCPQVYRFSHVLEIEENVARRASLRGGGDGDAPADSPVQLGTRVHGLLERVRFDAPDADVEIARLLMGQPGASHPALTRMLKAVIEGEIGSAIRSARRIEREWPFATRIGGVLIEGVIDLAIQGQDGRWTVVDYKSNDFSRTGRYEYLTDYYAPQLELYAMALAQAGIGTVADCALVFLTGPRIHRWAFDGAREDIGPWAEQTVAKIAAANYATTAGPKCDLCGYRKRRVCAVGRSWIPSAAVGEATALPTPRS